MPGFRNLFFSSLTFLALLGLAGCDGQDESEKISLVSPEVNDAIARLTAGDADAAPGALNDLVKAGDYRIAAFLKSFREGQSIYRWVEGPPEWKNRLVLVDKFKDGVAVLHYPIYRLPGGSDLFPISVNADGKLVTAPRRLRRAVILVTAPKAELQEVSAPRRLRRAVLAAEDTLKLLSPEESVCLEAAKKCGNSRRVEFLPALERLAEDPARSKKVHRVARTGICQIRISGNVPGLDDGAVLAAVKELGELQSESAISVLKDLEKKESTDSALGSACLSSIADIESYQSKVRNLKHVFNGISMGSVFILMALGLSIIFGLMGVINMAHGELMMVGAYTTYVVMNIFGHSVDNPASYYFIFAIPAAFLGAAFFGILIEFFVVRHLYGRPLDTLLATYACGLAMVQGARLIFGDNIGVNAPTQLVGSYELFQDFNIAKARVFIIFFSGFAVLLIYLLMSRTRTGLLIRATTQNRATARSLGVNSRFIDSMTFAFGSGLAGLAGCALTLIAGVTPDMGNNYIVDSFLVVVVGGVGELMGVIAAGLGIGVLNKVFEPFLGWFFPESTASVTWGKVLILVLVIAFIQWRPAGIFPPKGRLADV
ncbi:MAG: urea ABC transporter permease subunit UrtB [Planctomycetota bacterium]